MPRYSQGRHARLIIKDKNASAVTTRGIFTHAKWSKFMSKAIAKSRKLRSEIRPLFESGLKQQEIAEKLGRSQSVISYHVQRMKFTRTEKEKTLPKKKELSLYEKAAAAQRLRANPPSLIERLEKIEAFLFGGQHE